MSVPPGGSPSLARCGNRNVRLIVGAILCLCACVAALNAVFVLPHIWLIAALGIALDCVFVGASVSVAAPHRPKSFVLCAADFIGGTREQHRA